MTPDEAKQMYRDLMAERGEDIVIRRYNGVGVGRTYVDRSCRVRIVGYDPAELVGGITQGDRRIIVMAEDLAGESPPYTIAKTDKIVAQRFANELAIMAVDDSTRRVNGVLIAYDLNVRG